MGKSKELAELGDVVVQSNGNVGIATSSPVAKLQIRTQTDANAAFQNSTSVSGGVKINAFTDAANASVPFELDGSSLQFNTAAVERMRIDASGRVTMPYQPMFQVENTSGWSHPSGTVLAPYSTAINNVGGHYNTSTYRFTAPIGGTYIFNAWWGTGNSWGAHSYLGMRFRINNLDHRTGWEHNSTIGYARDDAVIIVKLNANDFVEAYLESAISGSLSGGAGMNGFQGCLLG